MIFSDTLGRARRSGPPIMKTVYSEDPHHWGRTVRDFHKPIKGTVPTGSRYHALNPELFYWAHATFVDQVLYVTDTFIRRLVPQEKVQFFEEGKTWYRLYGVSDRSQPQTYEEFLDTGADARPVHPDPHHRVRHRVHQEGRARPRADPHRCGGCCRRP